MADEVINLSCGECQWFVPLETHKGTAGECRADRPAVVVMPSPIVGGGGRAEIQVCFPTVPASLWCGRFVPRKVKLSS